PLRDGVTTPRVSAGILSCFPKINGTLKHSCPDRIYYSREVTRGTSASTTRVVTQSGIGEASGRAAIPDVFCPGAPCLLRGLLIFGLPDHFFKVFTYATTSVTPPP